MNTIGMIGQIISSTNYATDRIFNFNPGPVKAAARNFLAAGISEIEIPQAVLDPNGEYPEKGIDRKLLEQTKAGLPDETRVIGTYLSPFTLGENNEAYLERQKRALSYLIEYFPNLKYAMLHPVKITINGKGAIKDIVETFSRLAEHAVSLRADFQLCFHNHYDSNAETAEQVLTYLTAIEEINHPALTWGPDTGHCHGMKEHYLDVLDKFAHLIKGFFHIKARIPSFDSEHGGEDYDEKRDIWSNKAEIGSGLYSGFVNAADPEAETPFEQIFEIIRAKARPEDGLVRGAIEIDNPRQHPRLEALCAVLFLKNSHGLSTGSELSNDQIIRGVFAEMEGSTR